MKYLWLLCLIMNSVALGMDTVNFINDRNMYSLIFAIISAGLIFYSSNRFVETAKIGTNKNV